MKSTKTMSKGNISPLLITGLLIALVGGFFLYQNFLSGSKHSSWEGTAVENGDKIAYDNKTYKFRLTYPKDWSRQDTGLQSYVTDGVTNTVGFIIRPAVAQNVDQGTGTINVTVSQKQKTQSLDDLVSSNLSVLSQAFKNYQPLLSEKTTVSGLPAHKLIYTGETEGQKVKLMQIFIWQDSISYVLTYRISPENYDTYLDTANKIFNSFQPY